MCSLFLDAFHGEMHGGRTLPGTVEVVASVNVWKSNETCHYLMPHFWTCFKSWDLMVSAYLVLMDLVAPILLNEPCKGLTCLKYCSVAICIVINFQICTRFMCIVVVKEIVKAHFKLLWILDVHEKSLYSRHINCQEHSNNLTSNVTAHFALARSSWREESLCPFSSWL